ncbi:MAG: Inorganic pyrophospatase PpaX [uncultured Rubrobacteraceae bacterium]|uniref:Inorganic pyrophospatase PpaX n=1 Tax=uncultured Rubrobacteraceae bacterium TaxID=349277 RepID=A0A6J4PPV0_9ACTN|nr:MAG: Inorganic pyrophospatase PpaX [uncultured Rubrobacteraceae bacterium]
MLSAALFDFDGTLVDTTEMIFQSMRHATSSVLGREDLSRGELLANVGQPLPRQMELFDAEKAELLLEAYRAHHEEHHDALIAAFPGVDAALNRLRTAGVRIVVVTSKRRRSVEMALRSFPGLDLVVDRFVTMEDTQEHKPHPEPLLKGLELMGDVPRDQAAYVGDSPFDVQAAKAAGLTSVAVSWGAFSEDTLREAEPDYLVPDIDAVVDVLLTEGF